jgi:hypothetical protein
MSIGRSFVEQRGRIKLAEAQIATNWKGMLVLRALARKINQIQSTKKSGVRAALTQIATRWKTALTDSQRFGWEAYANVLKSAIHREREDAARGSHNVIRQRAKLESGFNAFIESNLIAYTSELSIPRDIAPLGEPFPPPPTNIALTVSAGIATVTWTDPVLVTPEPAEKKIRIWAQLQSYRRPYHTQLVGVVDFGVGSYSFSTLRSGGAWGSPFYLLNGVNFSFLRVQLETVVARTALQGAVVGSPSEVVEAQLILP